jgi:hypothetical protein
LGRKVEEIENQNSPRLYKCRNTEILHQYINTKREKGGKLIWILFSSIIITVAGVPVACSLSKLGIYGTGARAE